MSAATSAPLNGYPSPPEPGLTPEDVVARAKKIAATLVDRQLETEQRSSAVRAGARIERVWRDMPTLHSHAGVSIFLAGVANRGLAELVFDVVA